MNKREFSESLKNFFEVSGTVLVKTLQVFWLIIKWYFIIAFWTLGAIIFVIGFIHAIASGSPLPEYRPPQNPRRPKFDPNQFREKFPHLKVGDILKEFKDKLEQMERQGSLEPEQKRVVQKLRQFDRSKYNNRLEDVLENDELDELLLLILILLGVEVS